MDKYVEKHLDKHLIPDLNKVVLTYLCCPTCKTFLEGKIRCICGKYMCKCRKSDICPICRKFICFECCTNSNCCYENKDKNDNCAYCHKTFYNYMTLCIYSGCKTKLCKDCSNKHKSLCRGHIILKIHHPKYKGFEGLEGI